MDKIFAIVLVLIQYFLNPEQVKKREEEKIVRDAEKLDAAIDEHIDEFDSLMLAGDIDKLLAA